AGRPARRLLRPGAGQRAHAAQHCRRPLRRRPLPRRQRLQRRRSRPDAAISARHALPRHPRSGHTSGDPGRARHRLPPTFTGRTGRAAAAHFEDATTFFPVLGQYEVWQLINLTDDTHPIHVHLDPFQILSRRPIRYQIPDDGIEDLAITAAVTLERDPGDELGHTIDGNERGLKDTVRVNPNEITEIAVRFTTYSGRYMYHCHILEHEDRDMMRPFVTMPAELMPFMA